MTIAMFVVFICGLAVVITALQRHSKLLLFLGTTVTIVGLLYITGLSHWYTFLPLAPSIGLLVTFVSTRFLFKEGF
ncbi:hypothetical protein FLK61_27580 [Paenalkalicoccus suaedae]|uniref:Uncharacterized protein n=1 Tax=Paenalkalicoccus suaedae TaxID=2592382 RepID=A0A859FE57_9BACI|nr:hypothetical protein [Paenalkalicoccus suaedae]QKS70515.1 hypothetical protein FLK61_27580 [Paenalkalicoccus suaedae]